MRRLNVGQSVTAEVDDDHSRVNALDEEPSAISCVVTALSGPAAKLVRTVQIRPNLCERLQEGSFGFLVFTHFGGPVALRGMLKAAGADAAEINFIVVDGVQLPERRREDRVPFQTYARLIPRAPGAVPIEAVTVNLSRGGAMIRHLPVAPPRDEFELEIMLEDAPEPLRCAAVIVREAEQGLGIKFTHVPEPEQARLLRALAA